MGGFLLLFIIGAGKYSIDALLGIVAPCAVGYRPYDAASCRVGPVPDT
jgi:hypothetical protein